MGKTGQITFKENKKLEKGSELSFTVTPAKGFKILKVEVNGKEVEAAAGKTPNEDASNAEKEKIEDVLSYRIKNVTEDQSVIVYAENPDRERVYEKKAGDALI